VQARVPSAGTLVDPGTPVNIDLGTAEPDRVEVPYLLGMGWTRPGGRVESVP
jgi:hypothetical protein